MKEPEKRLGIENEEEIFQHKFLNENYLETPEKHFPRISEEDFSQDFGGSRLFEIQGDEELKKRAEIVELKEGKLVDTNWLIFPVVKVLVLTRDSVLTIWDENKTEVIERILIKMIRKVKKETPTRLRVECKDNRVRKFNFMEDDPDDWIQLIIRMR